MLNWYGSISYLEFELQSRAAGLMVIYWHLEDLQDIVNSQNQNTLVVTAEFQLHNCATSLSDFVDSLIQ
jgi:hypothetical protein